MRTIPLTLAVLACLMIGAGMMSEASPADGVDLSGLPEGLRDSSDWCSIDDYREALRDALAVALGGISEAQRLISLGDDEGADMALEQAFRTIEEMGA